MDEEGLTDKSPAPVENPGAWAKAASSACCEPLHSTGSSGFQQLDYGEEKPHAEFRFNSDFPVVGDLVWYNICSMELQQGEKYWNLACLISDNFMFFTIKGLP